MYIQCNRSCLFFGIFLFIIVQTAAFSSIHNVNKPHFFFFFRWSGFPVREIRLDRRRNNKQKGLIPIRSSRQYCLRRASPVSLSEGQQRTPFHHRWSPAARQSLLSYRGMPYRSLKNLQQNKNGGWTVIFLIASKQ